MRPTKAPASETLSGADARAVAYFDQIPAAAREGGPTARTRNPAWPSARTPASPQRACTSVAQTPGLVGYWRLGEATGTAACDAAGGDNGTYSGGFTLGRPGAIASDANTAAAFNGSTGYVSVPAATGLDVGDTFTAEAWV